MALEAGFVTHCMTGQEGIASEIRTSSKIDTMSTGKANDYGTMSKR